MLEAVTHRIPYTVPVGAGISAAVLESALPDTQVLDPKLVFINTHPSVAVVLTVAQVLDLGISADVEDDGVHSVTVVSAVSIPAGTQYVYTPPVNLIVLVTTPNVEHLISMSHAHLTETPIVQLLVTGKSEVTLRTNIQNFTRS